MKTLQKSLDTLVAKLLAAVRTRVHSTMAPPELVKPPDGKFTAQPLPEIRKIVIIGRWQVTADFNAPENGYAISSAVAALPRDAAVFCRRGKLIIRGGNGKVALQEAPPTLTLQLRQLPQTIELSGLATLRARPVRGKALFCRLDGMSRLRLKGGRLEQFAARLSGMSELKFSGRCDAGKLTLDGAAKFGGKAEFDTLQLQADGAVTGKIAAVRRAAVTLRGISRFDLAVREELIGRAAGAAAIRYSGELTPQIRLSGMATLTVVPPKTK